MKGSWSGIVVSSLVLSVLFISVSYACPDFRVEWLNDWEKGWNVITEGQPSNAGGRETSPPDNDNVLNMSAFIEGPNDGKVTARGWLRRDFRIVPTRWENSSYSLLSNWYQDLSLSRLRYFCGDELRDFMTSVRPSWFPLSVTQRWYPITSVRVKYGLKWDVDLHASASEEDFCNNVYAHKIGESYIVWGPHPSSCNNVPRWSVWHNNRFAGRRPLKGYFPRGDEESPWNVKETLLPRRTGRLMVGWPYTLWIKEHAIGEIWNADGPRYLANVSRGFAPISDDVIEVIGISPIPGDDWRVYKYASDPDNLIVPEPCTMLLMGSGLAGLAGIARRRRRQQ
jgi:hypothetical protein